MFVDFFLPACFVCVCVCVWRLELVWVQISHSEKGFSAPVSSVLIGQQVDRNPSTGALARRPQAANEI